MSPAESIPHKTVLLIDDVEETRLELAASIEQAFVNVRVVSVGSGPEAYHRLSQERVVGALLDRILSLEEDSASVFESLKERGIPVILMSGIHEDSRAPPPGCLRKPVHDERGRIRHDIMRQFMIALAREWALTLRV